MKKIGALLGLCGIIASATVSADQVCHENVGRLYCGAGTIENIDFKGLIDLDGTTVINTLSALGNVDAQNSHINNMTVRGNVYLSQSKINSDIHITGNVHANEG